MVAFVRKGERYALSLPPQAVLGRSYHFESLYFKATERKLNGSHAESSRSSRRNLELISIPGLNCFF